MRVLVGSVAHEFHAIDSIPQSDCGAVLDLDSYVASRALARALRDSGSDGVVYPSVRDPDGRCMGAFWPNVVGVPIQERHLNYQWDGVRVARYFDYAEDRWFAL